MNSHGGGNISHGGFSMEGGRESRENESNVPLCSCTLRTSRVRKKNGWATMMQKKQSLENGPIE